MCIASTGALAALALGLTGCGSSGGDDATSASAPDTTAPAAPSGGSTGTSITIKDFMFSPNPLKAKAGDTITITNEDGTTHTVTANDKSFDSGRFSEGSKTITVGDAGTYAFHCDIHDFMKGVIQVEG
jgi:plastocyanin